MEALLISILRNSLEISAIIVLAVAMLRLLGKKVSARFRCIVWTALAVLLLIPFQPIFALPGMFGGAKLPAIPNISGVTSQIAKLADAPVAQWGGEGQGTAADSIEAGGASYISDASSATGALSAPDAQQQSPAASGGVSQAAAPQSTALSGLSQKISLTLAGLCFLLWLAVAIGIIARRAVRLRKFIRQTRPWSRPATDAEYEALADAAANIGMRITGEGYASGSSGAHCAPLRRIRSIRDTEAVSGLDVTAARRFADDSGAHCAPLRRIRGIMAARKNFLRPLTTRFQEKTSGTSGTTRLPRLAICKTIHTPVLLGIFRPIILLPEIDYAPGEAAMLLAHELTHWRRKDGLTGLIVSLATAANWFNPFAYLLARHMTLDAELACDARATASFGLEEKKRYGALLIDAASNHRRRTPSLGLAFAGDAKNLKNRLVSIFDDRKKAAWAAVCLAAVLAVSAVGVSMVGCSAGGIDIPTPETLAASDKLVIYAPGHIYISTTSDGKGGTNSTQTEPQNPLFDAAVKAYKQLYPDVDVTYELIPDSDDNHLYPQLLASEMTAGGGPDVVYIDPNTFTDIYKTMDNGAFVDLAKILANDPDYNPEDYYQGVMNGGIYKGRQFLMPLSCMPPLFFADTSELNKIGFNLDNVTDTVSLLAEITRCLPKAQEDPAFVQAFARPLMNQLANMVALGISGVKIIDYENKTVLPDAESLRTLFEAASAYLSASGEATDNQTQLSGIMPGQNVLGDKQILFYPETYIQFAPLEVSTLNISGGDTAFMLKRPDGGVEADFYEAAAIRATSPNQLNAYNFIKVLLSDACQHEPAGSMYLLGSPVQKAAVAKDLSEGTLNFSGRDKGYGTFRKGDADTFTALMDTITDGSFVQYGTTVSDTFWNNMMPYFTDGTSFDDCVKKVKDELSLYLSE
ncbi:MAG: extracellular solute-binding protein [Defluviitaleaceae bacterium]|nr:extracellular solute-binding protein [Defluviitaleaceae bacterium]